MDEKKRSGRHSLSGENWELAALKALAKSGLDAVAIEPLARELGVTKGSAYWHFKDRNELLKAALERWERENDAATRDILARTAEPRARHRALLERFCKDPKVRRVEAAVQAAAQDPAVRPFVRRAQDARVAALKSEFEAMGMSPDEAAEAARLSYAACLGMLFIEWQGRSLPSEEWDRFLDFLVDRATRGSLPAHSQ